MTYDEELHARESLLVPQRWDKQFSALTDVGLEQGLRGLATDVLVTVTPALLACAVELAPDSVVVVHQEHRSSSQRTSGMEPLLVNAPRADVVALLTPSIADWLRGQLGAVAPEIVVMPNPLPQGFAPRSLLDSRTIVAAGRLVMEKQFTKLVRGLRRRRRPAARAGGCGSSARATSGRTWSARPASADSGTGSSCPAARPTCPASGAGRASARSRSRAEGFPLGLQEAMAAGVPCVTFDCASGPREIVRHEVNGLLVAPESIAGMSAALLRLGTDDDLRHRLGAGALESAAEWDADVLAGRWVAIFEAAIARRAGRPRYAALSAAPSPEPPATPAYDASGVTPAAARHAALSLAVAAARSATDEWLVVPPHETRTPVARAADGRPAPVPPGARGGRRAVVPLAARPGRERLARAPGARPAAGLGPAPRADVDGGDRAVAQRRPAPGAGATRRCSARAAPSRWSSGRRASTGSWWRRPATGTRSGSPDGSATVDHLGRGPRRPARCR